MVSSTVFKQFKNRPAMQFEETPDVAELDVLTDETPAENPVALLDGEEEEAEESEEEIEEEEMEEEEGEEEGEEESESNEG